MSINRTCITGMGIEPTSGDRIDPISGDRNPDCSTRRREDAKGTAVDGLGLGKLVVIRLVIGELSATLRAFALNNPGSYRRLSVEPRKILELAAKTKGKGSVRYRRLTHVVKSPVGRATDASRVVT
jgi:hypothetical protein